MASHYSSFISIWWINNFTDWKIAYINSFCNLMPTTQSGSNTNLWLGSTRSEYSCFCHKMDATLSFGVSIDIRSAFWSSVDLNDLISWSSINNLHKTNNMSCKVILLSAAQNSQVIRITGLFCSSLLSMAFSLLKS